MISRLFFALLFWLVVPCLHAAELPGIPQFIDEMVSKHQFDRDVLIKVFKRAEHRQSVIYAISTPATHKPWPEYRAGFINDRRISGGLKFWRLYEEALQRAEKEYGVPQEIIVALIGVETTYGRYTGKYNTLDALTTLAFDYPRRADFFRGELEQYLLLAREQELDLFKMQGSYAGALGIPQFMPGSYRKYAVDFSGNGKIDLLHDPVDAIGSVANYLKQYGWEKGGLVAVRASISEENFSGSLAETHTVAEWAEKGVKPDNEIIELFKIHDAVAPNPLPNPEGERTEPSPIGGGQGGGKTANLDGYINKEDLKARLVDFTLTNGKEFWLAFENFDVITHYNNSDFYAMAVFQLAEALRSARH